MTTTSLKRLKKKKKFIVRIFDLRDHSINEVNNAAHEFHYLFYMVK